MALAWMEETVIYPRVSHGHAGRGPDNRP